MHVNHLMLNMTLKKIILIKTPMYLENRRRITNIYKYNAITLYSQMKDQKSVKFRAY